MTLKTIEMAKAFVNRQVSAATFADQYIELWDAMSAHDLTSEGVSSDRASSDIYMLADLYNPNSGREEYELDESQLREKITDTLIKFGLQ